MPWELAFDEADKILTLTSHGAMQLATLRKMCADAIATGRGRGALGYLMDHRDMVPDIATLDIYSYPQFLDEMGVARNVKVTFIFSEAANADNVQFFENVMTNRDFQFRVFRRISSAQAWLKAKAG